MIESIRIQDEASYCSIPQDLKNLSHHNFIFGANGTGKTTISKIIADESIFPHCSVNWSGATKLETLVYNRDFVSKNFDPSSELKGIFTLGEEDKNALVKITTAKSELDALLVETKSLTKTLEGEDGSGGKKAELANLETDFEIKCWSLKQKHDNKLQGAFSGVRGKKSAFKEKLLAEANSNSAQLKPLLEIEQKAETVFGEAPTSVSSISEPFCDDLLTMESDPILSKKIIGKADVDIAAMIQKLGNSDWVKQGRRYYENNAKICPFCQQHTAGTLADSLSAYFDEAFENDTKAIEQLNTDYKTSSERLILGLQAILFEPSSYLDAEKFKLKKELLESKIRINLQRIDKKRKESSQTVNLESLSNVLAAVKGLITTANVAIKKHNTMVANLAQERRTLTAEVWRFLLDSEIKSELATYQKTKNGFSKAIYSLIAQIATKKELAKKKETETRELEKTTTSIQPTIDGINALLASFGFISFSLAKSERERFYKIVRPDGTDAKETLSEGEKNFITFLYFYHLLKGSEYESGMTNDRVVVLDDPVSSLDSDVLFIVSTLIKGLFEETRANVGHIKQIFILTHNVYFHKEVSFNSKRPNGGIMNEETFWTVRKSNNISVLESHTMNPIKTSYELLWMEVRDGGRSNLSIQNTLRRILENYFKILGNVNPDSLYIHFEGKEKLVCKSLFSWVNDGSHSALDDLYISVDGTAVDTYLEVFRKIFKKSGHSEHYKMMMDNNL
jgi:wobble nucleotide-excising tRNase